MRRMASPFNSPVRPKAERKRGLLIIAQLVAIQKISLESDLHPLGNPQIPKLSLRSSSWFVATKYCAANAELLLGCSTCASPSMISYTHNIITQKRPFVLRRFQKD